MAYRVRLAICNLALWTIVATAQAQAEPITIVALGDSLTAGYGLAEAQGLVPQLQAWLTARGNDVVMVNAGVSGDTSAGGLSRLGWSLTPDADALIVALGANDMLRGIDPAVTRANLDAILVEADAAGLPVLLVGVRSLGNYGADFRAAFDSMYPDLAAKHQTLLFPDFFAPLRSENATANLSSYIQLDGLHPNAKGVALVVEALGPQVAALAGRVGK